MNGRQSRMCSLLFVTALTACAGNGGSPPVQPVADSAFAARATSPTATVDAASKSIAIDAGGDAATGRWVADRDYRMAGRSGVETVRDRIDTSRVTDAAPLAIYRSQRYATQLTYAIPHLRAGADYDVRLHFVESYFHAARKRVFDVSIDGSKVLERFDIFAAAGGSNVALVKQFTHAADANGTLTVALAASVNHASLAGLEIAASAAAPVATAPPASPYADAALPPGGWPGPYDPSVFSTPACASDPCSPSLDASSESEVRAVVNGGRLDLGDIYEGNPGDNDFPVYFSSAKDPAYTVTCDRGGCGTGTISVRIPDGAYASDGSDHHLAVVDLATGIESDFWEFNDRGTGTGSAKPVYGGGSLSAASGGVCQMTSFAHNVNACANSATGSGLPILPQVLDPREILAGNIAHTLYVAIGCGQSGYVFPATHSDGTCHAGPKYGERIWLDLSDARIEALPDPGWAKTLLHAMHRYGWIVSDSNGASSGIAFANLAAQTFTLWGQANPWAEFFRVAGGGNYVTLPTAGISQANVHILAPCVNTRSC